ncbi:MAG TPA: hypothetical protein VN193_11755 [Candidatus Angelobacter sp.]|nr:hypothetical protein [Candidatus Angelobacter sp.]
MSKRVSGARGRPTTTRPGGGRQRRTGLILVLLAVAAVVVGIVTTVIVSSTGTTTSSTTNPQTPQPLASVDTSATGATVDGIQCQTNEQVVYHVHAHLAIYVNGAQRSIPAGIGIAPPRQIQTQSDGTPFVVGGSCFYWLHSHTADGIIHIESPDQRQYTLGNWFDIWQQPLSATQVGPVQGAVIAYVDGQRYTGDPRNIVLGAHTLVQLDLGQNVAPQPFSFPAGL